MRNTLTRKSATVKNEDKGWLSKFKDDIIICAKMSIQTPEFRLESRMLILVVFFYIVLGLAMSASPTLYSKSANLAVGGMNFDALISQAFFMALGFAIFLLSPFVNVDIFRKPACFILFSVVVAILQFLPPIIGQTLNGASRWLFGVQVSDILAIYLIFYAAFICSDGEISQECETLKGSLIYILVPLGLVVFFVGAWQRNFSTAALLSLSTCIILWLGRIRIDRKLLIGLVIVALLGGAWVFSNEAYRLNRLKNWMKYDLVSMSPRIEKKEKPVQTEMKVPSENENATEEKKTHSFREWDENFRNYVFGDGSQAFYSKLSVMSGGPSMSGSLIGFGPGGGRINASGKLAISEADYIFSVLCAEWGFLGISALLAITVYALFKAMHFRAPRTEVMCLEDTDNPSSYLHLLAMGVVVMISMQALSHIFVNLSLFPVTGIPLPLFSNGGTSRVIILAMLGILLNTTCKRQSNFPPFIAKRKKMLFYALVIAFVAAIAYIIHIAFGFITLQA